MSVDLNHMIISAKDRWAAARFLADILGLEAGPEWGPFVQVRTHNGVTLDFDTTDGGLAGLHFVSLQRAIADFVATRTAMNATSAQLQNPSISDTVNNGINEFIFVTKRGNYLLPARAERSFPLLPGRAAALAGGTAA